MRRRRLAWLHSCRLDKVNDTVGAAWSGLLMIRTLPVVVAERQLRQNAVVASFCFRRGCRYSCVYYIHTGIVVVVGIAVVFAPRNFVISICICFFDFIIYCLFAVSFVLNIF
ncbi:unnamed protein product [Ceratitis capitata]|uniref:(Mediterranean fruit fly) hypothetical protein n=1 Tax=Ceratitis capitata TaxID=7213 RepID=A0A811UBS8_CERCA|nr:unnamed protein product [Ceratitis capitata]